MNVGNNFWLPLRCDIYYLPLSFAIQNNVHNSPLLLELVVNDGFFLVFLLFDFPAAFLIEVYSVDCSFGETQFATRRGSLTPKTFADLLTYQA